MANAGVPVLHYMPALADGQKRSSFSESKDGACFLPRFVVLEFREETGDAVGHSFPPQIFKTYAKKTSWLLPSTPQCKEIADEELSC